MNSTALDSQIQAALESYEISCSLTQAKLLAQHLELVIEKNKLLNLTRITSVSEAVILHILDSCLGMCIMEKMKPHEPKGIDIGSGAGYPGIPLAILTESHWMLCDSVAKKANALKEFVTALGLESRVKVSSERIEDVARSHKAAFDLVTTRAVGKLTMLIEYASPLLKQNGLLLAYKAKPEQDELDDAIHTAELCGMDYVSRETFELPNGLGHREIYVYRRSGKAKVKLPRAVGMAKKSPLV